MAVAAQVIQFLLLFLSPSSCQTGRLVNIDNFNIYTIASVLKKFLSKIPGGIFGSGVEARLFEISEWDDIDLKREEINK